MQNANDPAGPPAFREKLSAPLSWYFIAWLFALAFAIIFLVVDPWLSLGSLIGVGLLSCWAVDSYGRKWIEVTESGVIAGAATVPLEALGKASALDREGARALQTHDCNPLAFMLLRSYVTTAVRIENVDPTDRTPYLYLSSRRPEQLAAAVNALRH
jgi:hypothetical protein